MESNGWITAGIIIAFFALLIVIPEFILACVLLTVIAAFIVLPILLVLSLVKYLKGGTIKNGRHR